MLAKTSTPEQVPQLFQMAWNEHDMAAFASLFCEDASFVNRFGHYVKGVDEIIAMHAPIHATIYRDSTLQNDIIELNSISNDVTLIHFWSRLSAGLAHPAGPHQVDTLILCVLTKQNDAWFIRALENVTLTNPRTGQTILRDHI
ncbi:SgcJ/EcaC family oxidoreductase [Acinetobacter colistiniresistens]|uniref:SgcJ/EcaC family oxidoreductase n=1 Tax=Acinetobacter colistiniresistens TaxID=280145 RepID=A0A558F8M3_9GAMM|nr:SgcJ/EcaC family oxidoreductase [Acinetobacter colistiniresistens]TVT81639.1 SgcJ/EcaC family oxidoreductase [Acinetobacter colistiniresistens]